MRYKRPDSKDALSLVESAKREMAYTLTIALSEESGATIIRNIYECFRMLGDALLVKKGINSQDHLLPIAELVKLEVKLPRPINLVDNLRRLRHNINYYGYKPNLSDVNDILDFANPCFSLIAEEVENKVK